LVFVWKRTDLPSLEELENRSCTTAAARSLTGSSAFLKTMAKGLIQELIVKTGLKKNWPENERS
jgi:hypothetical protein